MPNKELPVQTVRDVADLFHASVNTIISLGKEHPELQPPFGLTSVVNPDGKSVILSKPGSFSMQLKAPDSMTARVNIRRFPSEEEINKEKETGIKIPREMTLRSSDSTKDPDPSERDRYPTVVITKTIGGNIYSKKNNNKYFMFNPTKNDPVPENPANPQGEKFPEEYVILAKLLAIYATIYNAKAQKQVSLH